ncbi:hypothetical protein FKM82_008672 [Ascaphus truei]
MNKREDNLYDFPLHTCLYADSAYFVNCNITLCVLFCYLSLNIPCRYDSIHIVLCYGAVYSLLHIATCYFMNIHVERDIPHLFTFSSITIG